MEIFHQFTRFAGVGVIGTAAHYLVLITLVQIGGVDPVWASGSGFVAGAFFNYQLNYRYTFHSNKKHREAIIKFFIVAAIGLALNSLVIVILARHIGLHYLLSQVVATGLVLVWNFAGNRFWTFREKTIGTQR